MRYRAWQLLRCRAVRSCTPAMLTVRTQLLCLLSSVSLCLQLALGIKSVAALLLPALWIQQQKTLLVHVQEDALGWRAKATEAIGIIAEAIGIEPFRPHIQGIMQAAFQVPHPAQLCNNEHAVRWPSAATDAFVGQIPAQALTRGTIHRSV